MKELKIIDKQKYLDENCPFGPFKLTDKVECIHCHSIIVVGDYKVYRANDGFELICCPNAPDCNGTAIDWWQIRKRK